MKKVHVYDFLNRNKKGVFNLDDFISISINENIDDFSTATLSSSLDVKPSADFYINVFDNIYIEDGDGLILFGGLISSITGTESGLQLTCYDHRWILTRLVLDEAKTVSTNDNVLDVVKEFIDIAKSKRQIPISFDEENSQMNPDYNVDLKFEVGDSIGGAIQTIIKNTYARWQMRYYKKDGFIYGKLVIRSVVGVTPEGVGISRSKFKSEDGDIVKLFYKEGGKYNNLQSFNFKLDLTSYTSRVRLGVKINGESEFVENQNDWIADWFENTFGRCEEFATDYKINSLISANESAIINKNYPEQTIQCTLSPLFDKHLRAGDRVGLEIISPILIVGSGGVRVDSISYNYNDGFFDKQLVLNTMSPQKRSATTGIVDMIGDMQNKLDGLDKNYFNNSSS